MRRTLGGAIGAGILVLVGWAGVAFACTAAPPEVYSILPESAAPGSTVVVQGRSVRSDAPVDIRWNGVGGQRLATATPASGAFSVPVQIPAVSPGVYSLTAVTADGRVGRTAFEVTSVPGSAPAAPAPLWPSVAERSATTSPGGGVNQAGVALLALGLVGLFAGSTVAVSRRRRVLAVTPK